MLSDIVSLFGPTWVLAALLFVKCFIDNRTRTYNPLPVKKAAANAAKWSGVLMVTSSTILIALLFTGHIILGS